MHFQCNNNYFQSLFIFLFTTTISIYFVRSKETCDENVIADEEEVFEYQDNLNWRMGFQENGINELENWFYLVKNSKEHFDAEKCEDKLDSHQEGIKQGSHYVRFSQFY